MAYSSTVTPSFGNVSPTKPDGFRSKGRENTGVSFRRQRVSTAASSSTAERTACVDYLAPSAASSFYDVLGIKAGASHQEIKTAYRRLARVLHPDANNESDDSSRKFIELHEAYETLSDPEKRAVYDRSLFYLKVKARSSSIAMSARTVSPLSSSSGSAAASGFSGYTRRRWETDQCW